MDVRVAMTSMMRVVALGNLLEPHAISEWLLATFTVVAGLTDVDVTLDSHQAHETLIANHITALRVRIDEAILQPLTKATILSLYMDDMGSHKIIKV